MCLQKQDKKVLGRWLEGLGMGVVASGVVLGITQPSQLVIGGVLILIGFIPLYFGALLLEKIV